MKPLFVANWKMNPQNSKDAFLLAGAVAKGVQGVEADVVLCVPFLYVPQLFASRNVFIGGQDCFWEEQGAFTGEISPAMLKNSGCSYVILGHSERKKYLGETLAMVNKKVLEALKATLIPMICIGENVKEEMAQALQGIQKEDMNRLVLVYEPSYAISTAENARPETPEQAKEAVDEIKRIAGQNVCVLYGGSVNSKNIKNFMQKAGVDGALVGVSSLEAKEFVSLVKNGTIF